MPIDSQTIQIDDDVYVDKQVLHDFKNDLIELFPYLDDAENCLYDLTFVLQNSAKSSFTDFLTTYSHKLALDQRKNFLYRIKSFINSQYVRFPGKIISQYYFWRQLKLNFSGPRLIQLNLILDAAITYQHDTDSFMSTSELGSILIDKPQPNLPGSSKIAAIIKFVIVFFGEQSMSVNAMQDTETSMALIGPTGKMCDLYLSNNTCDLTAESQYEEISLTRKLHTSLSRTPPTSTPFQMPTNIRDAVKDAELQLNNLSIQIWHFYHQHNFATVELMYQQGVAFYHQIPVKNHLHYEYYLRLINAHSRALLKLAENAQDETTKNNHLRTVSTLINEVILYFKNNPELSDEGLHLLSHVYGVAVELRSIQEQWVEVIVNIDSELQLMLRIQKPTGTHYGWMSWSYISRAKYQLLLGNVQVARDDLLSAVAYTKRVSNISVYSQVHLENILFQLYAMHSKEAAIREIAINFSDEIINRITDARNYSSTALIKLLQHFYLTHANHQETANGQLAVVIIHDILARITFNHPEFLRITWDCHHQLARLHFANGQAFRASALYLQMIYRIIPGSWMTLTLITVYALYKKNKTQKRRLRIRENIKKEQVQEQKQTEPPPSQSTFRQVSSVLSTENKAAVPNKSAAEITKELNYLTQELAMLLNQTFSYKHETDIFSVIYQVDSDIVIHWRVDLPTFFITATDHHPAYRIKCQILIAFLLERLTPSYDISFHNEQTQLNIALNGNSFSLLVRMQSILREFIKQQTRIHAANKQLIKKLTPSDNSNPTSSSSSSDLTDRTSSSGSSPNHSSLSVPLSTRSNASNSPVKPLFSPLSCDVMTRVSETRYMSEHKNELANTKDEVKTMIVNDNHSYSRTCVSTIIEHLKLLQQLVQLEAKEFDEANFVIRHYASLYSLERIIQSLDKSQLPFTREIKETLAELRTCLVHFGCANTNAEILIKTIRELLNSLAFELLKLRKDSPLLQPLLTEKHRSQLCDIALAQSGNLLTKNDLLLLYRNSHASFLFLQYLPIYLNLRSLHHHIGLTIETKQDVHSSWLESMFATTLPCMQILLHMIPTELHNTIDITQLVVFHDKHPFLFQALAMCLSILGEYTNPNLALSTSIRRSQHDLRSFLQQCNYNYRNPAAHDGINFDIEDTLTGIWQSSINAVKLFKQLQASIGIVSEEQHAQTAPRQILNKK